MQSGVCSLESAVWSLESAVWSVEFAVSSLDSGALIASCSLSSAHSQSKKAWRTGRHRNHRYNDISSNEKSKTGGPAAGGETAPCDYIQADRYRNDYRATKFNRVNQCKKCSGSIKPSVRSSANKQRKLHARAPALLC